MNNLYSCYITHIEIVGRLIKVWVQHNTKNASEIEEAISSIKTGLEYEETPTSIDQFTQRGVYLAKYSDKEYYRCAVLGRSSSSPNKINVAFIDYGNTQPINISDMRMITAEMKVQLPVLALPGQATFYYLYAVAVKPGSMTERDLSWLKALTLNSEFQCCMYEGVLGIRMISIYIEHNLELSYILVQKNLGQMISREELSTMVKDLMQYSAGISSYTANSIAQQVRYPPPTCKIEVITSQRKPSMPIYQPPPVYQQNIISQLQVSSIQQQQRFIPSKDKLSNMSSYPLQSAATKSFDNTITVGSAYQMYVSHVEDGPLQFSLQLRLYADEVLPYLSSQMSLLTLQNFTSALTVGTIVIGMHQPDKTLRRAMIISQGSNMCKVYYVDVGSSESLQFSNIFQLPTSLNVTQIPAVGINFSLRGMEASQVSESIKRRFEELVMSKVVLAKVITEGPMRTCDLFVDGRDVKTLLATLNQPLQYLRQLPPREKDITVLVSYVEGPHQIFVQYKSESNTLTSIEETLALQWPNQKEIVNDNDLTIGKPVISLYSSDNQWYRAQIMEISKNQSVTVFYVDYGNKEHVNVSTLREISSDLVSKWRCQAVECCLVGFDSIVPTNVLAEKLEEKILSSELTLQLNSLLSADRLLVDLIDSSGNSIAAYMTQLHNHRLAEAQNVPVSNDTSSMSRDSSALLLTPVETKSDKEFDFNDKKDSSHNQKWKLKDSLESQSSSKYKSKGQDDSSYTRDWKSKDQNEPSFGKSLKSRDQEDSLYNKGYKSREQDDSSYNKGYKSREQDDSSYNKGYKSREQDDSSYNKGYKSRDQEDSSYNKGYKSREQDDLSYNKGYKLREQDDLSYNKGFKSKDQDDSSFNRGYKSKDYDDSSFNKGWKSKDRSDSFNKGYKSKDNEGSSFNKGFKPKDQDDSPPSAKWKSRDDDSNRSNKWKYKDQDDLAGDKWKSKESRGYGGDSDGFRKPRDEGGKWKGRDDGKGSGGRWGRDDSGPKKDWKQPVGRRPDDDTARKGRGEFKWNEDLDSKKPGKTLYSDSPDKKFARDKMWDNDSATTSATSDFKFNPKVKEYVGWNLENKNNCMVTLAHIDSPERFFVRLLEADSELDTLRDMIDSDSNTTSRVLPPKAVVVGTPVLAVYSEDKQLYRAVIEKVNSSTVDVLFVDYGNSSEVNWSELYYPSDSLARLPMTVIRCSLSHVKPMGSSWTTDQDALIQAFGGESHLNMNIESVKLVDGLPVHNVSLTVAESGLSVVQSLADCGLAKSTSGKGSSPSLQTQESVEPILALPLPLTQEPTATEDEWVERVELLVGQFLMSRVLSVISGESIIVKLDAANLLVVCVSPDTSSVQIGDTVIIQVNCVLEDRLRVTIYDKGGFVAGDSKKELPQVSPVCQMPLVRSRFRVQVPFAETCYIYIQKTSDSDKIADMLEALFNFYEETKPSGKEFSPNSLCAAKSSDENWYRARVLKKDGDNYTIRFIDYGNTEMVPGSQLRKLDSQFYFPELAFKAHVPLKWRLPEEELDLLKYLDDKEWTASLIKHNTEDWYVSLVDDDNKKLFDLLKQDDLGENYKENPFYEVNSVIGNDILAGDKIPVTVTHVESPEHFWVQMIKHVQTVETLQDKLQEFTETKKDSNCAVFAAKYSADNLWYRALGIDSNTPDLVRFIDYGNTDTVSERKDLSHSLTKPRSGYAVQMCLCAAPKDSSGWSQEALDMFETFIDANEIIAEIVTVSYKIVTDLTVDGKSISKMLIEKGFAVYEDFTPSIIKNYLTLKESGQVSNVFICHTVSPNDFYTLEKNREPELEDFTMKLQENEDFSSCTKLNLGSLVAAKFPEDESWYRAKITKLDPLTVVFTDFGNSSIVDEVGELPSEFLDIPPFAVRCSLDVEESDLVLDKFLELSDEGKNVFNMSLIRKGDPNIVKLTLNDTDVLDLLPKVQKTIVNIDGQVGFVSHFNTFDDFYVQMKDNSKLDNVVDELCAAETFSDVEKISIGSLVAALFSEDGMWYRAKVTLLDPLTVIFYDYGNSSEVSQVKELPPDLKLIPALAYRCSYDRPQSISEWTDTIMDEFLELSQDGLSPFKIKVMKNGSPMIITLLNENNEEVIKHIVGDGKGKTSNQVANPNKTADIKSKSSDISDSKTSESDDKAAQITYSINNKFVTISHFESVDDFHVVCIEDSSILNSIVEKLSTASCFEVNDKIEEGVYVVAECPEINEWKRAKVLSVHPIKVIFIDCGMICNVSSTRKLPENVNVSLVKPLAVHCALKKPKNCNIWPEGVSLLADYMALSSDKLKMKVHSKVDPCIVSLYLNDRNIISKMGDEFIGTPATFMFQTPSLYNNKIVFICYAESIRSFYVQKETDSSKLEEITETLSNSGGFEPVENLEVGDIVSAKFPDDNIWYRSLVLLIEPEIKVKFVDYGNSSVVTEVRDLPEDLKELPPLSLHCSLDLPRGLNVWPKEAEELFMEVASNGETPYVLRAVSPGDPCLISLLKSNEELSKTLARDAIPVDVEEPKPVDNLIKPNPKRSVYRDFADIADPDIVESISPNSEMNNRLAILSHINSLDEFYVQLLDDADKITDIIEKMLDGDSFEDIKDDSEDCMIAALFSDMQWHRAKILKKLDKGYEVFFIDYGNTSEVIEIKELPPDVKEIQPLAYKLSLKKPEGVLEWTEDMQKQFVLFKDINSLPVVILTQPSGYVTLMLNDINIYNKFTTLSLEGFGENMVFVTFCESPANFYVQYNSSFDDQQLVLDLLRDVENFKDADNVDEGDVVVAQYPEDQMWYRSKILKTSPDLCVLFIDFGHTAVINKTKYMPEQLKSIGPLVKQCCFNPPRTGSGWSPEACSYFLALSSSSFTIKIIEDNSDGPSVVDLLLEGNSVVSELLELCPVGERLPDHTIYDDMDIDDEDVLREEALFNAEESMRTAQNIREENYSRAICNGLSDLAIDEKDESIELENSRNSGNSNRALRIDHIEEFKADDASKSEVPSLDEVTEKEVETLNDTVCDNLPESSAIVENKPESSTDVEDKLESSTIVEDKPENSTVVESKTENSTVIENKPESSIVIENEPKNVETPSDGTSEKAEDNLKFELTQNQPAEGKVSEPIKEQLSLSEPVASSSELITNIPKSTKPHDEKLIPGPISSGEVIVDSTNDKPDVKDIPPQD